MLFFRMLDVKWGPHSVGRFACSFNTKLARCNSGFHQPGTEAVDAFTPDWKHENNWLLPQVFPDCTSYVRLKDQLFFQCGSLPIFRQSRLETADI